MRRLGIFLFYDELGYVSDHMKRSLRAFRPHLDELIFVANGEVDAASMVGLEDVVTQTVVRENVGYDVWGYKHGLEHVGYDALGAFDEVVLFNYTFFAPLHDLDEMFTTMAGKPVDFWGLTEYTDPEKSFLQSYFLVSRRSLHSTQAFMDYWKNMPMITSIDDSLDFHEFRFARNFAEAGFSYEPYIANDPHWGGNTTLIDLPGLHAKGMPVAKYRAFNFEANYLQRRGGASPAENIQFIKDETTYPVGEIWDYLISQTSAQDLIRNAELLKIVSQDTARAKTVAKVCYGVTLRDIDQLDMALDYLSTVPKDKIWIGSPDPEIVTIVKEQGYRVKAIGEADIALRAWHDALTTGAGAKGYIVNLSDFPGERPRYDFLQRLFSAYWGPFVGSCRSLATLTKWLRTERHIGMVFADTNSIDGRESAHMGLSRHRQGWLIDTWAAALRSAENASIWPWRGNAMLRASVVNSDSFKGNLDLLVPSHAPRRRDPFSGIEAFFPEMVRRARAACALIVQDRDAAHQILRSGLIVEQANDRVSKLAQNFRDSRDPRADVTANALAHPSRVAAKPNGVAGQVVAPNLTFDRFTMSLDKLSDDAPAAAIRTSKHPELTLDSSDFAQLAIDEIEVQGARIFVRGWVYDAESPQSQLMCGLFADGVLRGKMSVVLDFRPDVALAFPTLGLHDDTGFQLEYQADAKIDMNAVTFHMAFVDIAATKVMIAPVAPYLNRGALHALSSLFRNRP